MRLRLDRQLDGRAKRVRISAGPTPKMRAPVELGGGDPSGRQGLSSAYARRASRVGRRDFVEFMRPSVAVSFAARPLSLNRVGRSKRTCSATACPDPRGFVGGESWHVGAAEAET